MSDLPDRFYLGGFESLVAHDAELRKWLLDHGLSQTLLDVLPDLLHTSAASLGLTEWSPLELWDAKLLMDEGAPLVKQRFVEIALQDPRVRKWLCDCMHLSEPDELLKFLSGSRVCFSVVLFDLDGLSHRRHAAGYHQHS
jgi:hypothetical protein